MGLTMIVDERFSSLERAVELAPRAKYADALRNISLACRSSLFSRSRAFSFAPMSLVTPGLRPASVSAFFAHSFKVWAVQPIFPAIETTAAHRDGCSAS